MKKKIFIGLGVVLVALLAFSSCCTGCPREAPQKPLSLAIGAGYKCVLPPIKKGGLFLEKKRWRAAAMVILRGWCECRHEITFSKTSTLPVTGECRQAIGIMPCPGRFIQISLNSQTGIYFAVNQPDYKLDVVKVICRFCSPTEPNNSRSTSGPILQEWKWIWFG